uniref:Putative secreted protein n=1 Tax=uncultured bacterium Contig1578 TaxID=1393460 RepID=W0FNZ7_9BACT|nr:putative secreted protein [uncultured bacterium Contig1578]
MNKSEFLDRLNHCLAALPAQEKARLNDYYAEMIDDRVENGMSEEEAVAALGDPVALAGELLTGWEDGAEQPQAMTVAPQDGSAVGGFEKVYIRLKHADARILRGALSEGEAARIDASQPDCFEWRQAGGTLEITELDAAHRGFFRVRTVTLTLTLGDVALNRLMVESSGGDVTLQDLAAREARLHTGSGDIAIRSLQCDGALEAVAASGDVTLEHCDAGGRVNLRSISGEVELSRLDHAEVLSAQSVSGDVKISHAQVDTAVNVRSVSGDVTISGVEGGAVAVQTSSGDATLRRCQLESLKVTCISGDLSLEAVETAGSIEAEGKSSDIDVVRAAAPDMRLVTVSGDVDVRLPFRAEGYDIDAFSRSGDVHLPGEDARARFDDPRRVSARSTSGDVSVSLLFD